MPVHANTHEKTDQVDLWDQYIVLVELFKFYLDLIIKANVFYSAVSGVMAESGV